MISRDSQPASYPASRLPRYDHRPSEENVSPTKRVALTTAALVAAFMLGTIAPRAHAVWTDQQARELVAELRGIRSELGQLRNAMGRK